jgi:hypothetical protein
MAIGKTNKKAIRKTNIKVIWMAIGKAIGKAIGRAIGKANIKAIWKNLMSLRILCYSIIIPKSTKKPKSEVWEE